MINPLRVCENLPQDVSAFVKEASKKAIAERGQFVVALSGGSLPNMLLSLLQDGTVHFSKWQVLFVDERFVPLDHADSNFLACSPLLARVPRQQIYAIDPTLSLERCAAEYEERVAKFKIDLVLLGMGEDGHTASLFPNHPLLQEERRLIAPISDSPKPPPNRVTFTFPLILSAREIAFVAGGAGKIDAMEWIFKQKRQDIPAAIVLQKRPDTVFFTDKKAAAKL